MSTHRIAGETGNFQKNNAPQSNPTPADDALAIERADDWLFSEHSPEAVGDECFPTAVAVATILREQGLSMPFAQDRVERWNSFACTPKLDQRDIERAVHLAYSDPTTALELVTRPVRREQALRAAQPETQVAPARLQGGPRDALAAPCAGAE